MGPVEQVLESQRQNTAAIFQGLQLGSNIVQFATQARLSLRSQALQEQSLQLEQRRTDMAVLDFQQRSKLFELQKEKWTLERRQIEAELAATAVMEPLNKLKAAAGLQTMQRQLEGQAEFEVFGSDAIGAIQHNAASQKQAITEGRVPEVEQGMLDLFRLYPNLMTHPEVVKVQDAANRDVADFRERWMMTAGRASGGRVGSTLSQDFFTLQQLKVSNPALAEEFERDVINNRYKSEDPAVQAALIRLKAVASNQASLPEDIDAAEKIYLEAARAAQGNRSLPLAPSAVTSPDWDDFLNMRSQGLTK